MHLKHVQCLLRILGFHSYFLQQTVRNSQAKTFVVEVLNTALQAFMLAAEIGTYEYGVLMMSSNQLAES